MPKIRIALDGAFVFVLGDQILLWGINPLSVMCVSWILNILKILVPNTDWIYKE